jgi:uncharacterized membrane protein
VISALIAGLADVNFLTGRYSEVSEHNKRTVAKAITWQIIGFTAMMCIAFLYTGATQVAVSMSITTMLMSSVSYVIHERVWNRINWGRHPL